MDEREQRSIFGFLSGGFNATRGILSTITSLLGGGIGMGGLGANILSLFGFGKGKKVTTAAKAAKTAKKVSSAQHFVLSYLKHIFSQLAGKRTITQAELVKDLGITRTRASRLFSALVRLNYLKMKNVGGQKHYSLTDEICLAVRRHEDHAQIANLTSHK